MSTHPTLGERLGIATPISQVLLKAEKLGLGPRELQTLAIQRGCIHYSTGDEPEKALASEEDFSNEDLAAALLSPALPYDPRNIRIGAAMLSAEGNNPARLAELARKENSIIPIRYIADSAQRYEPENPFWRELTSLLPPCVPQAGALPHPTRFITMTGFTRKGPGIVTEWQRPRRGRQLAHD